MRVLPALIALGVAACSPQADTAKPSGDATTAAAPAAAPAPIAAPAGEYSLDPSHTSVIFKVDHLGLSHYTARFTKVAGKLAFDPARPEAQSVNITIDADSLRTDYPEPAKLDFDKQVQTQFLEAAKHPQITFKSTKVEPTGPRTARVTGDLTLHGVTKPVTLETTFNGGYPKGGMDPSGARIGFSAHGTFKRSDFGIAYGLPAPGTNMGVGDDVGVIIEAEFTMQ